LIDAVTIASAVVSLSGLSGVIASTIRRFKVERKLQAVLNEDDVQLRRLEALTKDLGKNPDPVRLEECRQILDSLTQKLSDSDRSEILKTLDRVSDQSRANYISKLVEDVEARSSPTTG
jgi:hypothetical protein